MTESITMLERRFQLFPAKFYWRGQVHQVDAVNECKTETHPADTRSIYHYWVRCGGKQLHLSQAMPAEKWLLHQDGKE